MTIKTAESVCIGHPDKLCDLIAETILASILLHDPAARVAIEAAVKGKHVYVFGEITTSTRLRLKDWTRKALLRAGYDAKRFRIHLNVTKQSADIDHGVSLSHEARNNKDTSAHALLGAGDQGTVYGYAVNENQHYLPTPLVIAHEICRRLDEAREKNIITGIKSDGKAQVSVFYNYDGKPVEVTAIVVSIQHTAAKQRTELEREIRSLIINPALGGLTLSNTAKVLINPAGPFIKGGPDADAGLTGRKLAVDTYGGLGPHGGGAFAGKDPSKVDRTAALMARHIARSIVTLGAAEQVTVAISFAIGKADPLAFSIDTHGTGTFDRGVLESICLDVFPLRPSAMIEALELHDFSQYEHGATYGYFSRYSTWESYSNFTDKLREEMGKNEIAKITR